MTPSPFELDRYLEAKLAEPRWRTPFRLNPIWLPAREMEIGGRRWHGGRPDENGHWTYTRRQARQMRRALRPVLAKAQHQIAQHYRNLMN